MTNENNTMNTAENNEIKAPEYKKTVFTLIIYTPGEEGWHDRRGDYHSGKESSLEMEYFESKEDLSHEKEIAERMGRLKFENDDVELKLLFNGIEPNNEPDYFYDDNEEEAGFMRGTMDYIDTLAYEHTQKLKQAEEMKKAEAKRVKEAEELNLRLREKHAQEEREKAEYLRLKAKFGN